MAEHYDSLTEYNRKRDFTRTAEPKGASKKGKAGKLFLVQKHDATRLHYDFRLEWKGVLKSWAVTRGPSINPDDKRLAVRTEDHPMAYGDFEGTIPKKQYGGGTVMLWDTGWWEPDNDPDEGLKEGKLKFHLHGQRMHGGWTLVRMKPRNGEKRENWLLIKEHDGETSEDGESLLTENLTSVKSGRSMGEIASGQGERKAHVWESAKSAAANVKAGAVAEEKSEPPKERKRSGKAPTFVKAQLATLTADAPDGDDWLNEAKFDGYRLMVSIGKGGVTCFTRTGLDWTEKFPDIANGLMPLDCDTALIDGEAVAASNEGSKFSALQKAIKTGGETRFYAFDLLHLDGKDLRKAPLVERKEALKVLLDTLEPGPAIQYSEHVRGNGRKVFQAMCKAGQEGIIAKKADASYREGRAGNWLKIKCTKRQEFVIGGYSPSDKRGRAFASLLVGAYDGRKFVYQGRVGTGFDEETMADLAARFPKLIRKTSPFDAVPNQIAHDAVWLTPNLAAEIDFAEFTDDGHIRHGAFQGLREDKEASAVTLETKKPAPTSKAAVDKPEVPGADKKRPPHKEKDADGDVLGIRITHADRLLFSDPAITKVDLARYYGVIAVRMLPFAADHPASILRCPQGPDHQCFYQKHAGDGFPDEIHQVPIEESDGDTANYLYVNDAKGLVAAVQMGTIELHIWGSTIDRLDAADRLVFDLDPDPSVTFETVKQAAVLLRDALEELGLKSVAMVSGGKGIHVIVPLSRRAPWEDAKTFAKGLSAKIADEDPENYIATMSKAKRKGRIFIDWLRNERGSTAVAPYSVRARSNGPVATPVSWDELGDLGAANGFHIPDILERLESGIDPWAEAKDWKQSLTKAMLKAVEAGD
ncbi:DNA ligase D [Rhizobium sp. LjRoot98]|uniref:DNA ligase D n=1 Tax=unclassified Rhizobium TaxID=2613769 RepID=UPI0007146AD9|nr:MULTISPECIES: DNA ligase D [unclassified Rhizobium]KQV29127.1 ATP-dependent DNA ligase [Rhizobium sp. Root1204]KQY03622.1 ATP-dependent DNA ligase [Rhizobium sp. Root1334]KRC00265.1 ATP-dependent DNA ligase [Rhizobium sp. Root73]